MSLIDCSLLVSRCIAVFLVHVFFSHLAYNFLPAYLNYVMTFWTDDVKNNCVPLFKNLQCGLLSLRIML
jgi:hypothetical protein